MDRKLNINHPLNHLISSIVTVDAVVLSISENNPYTKSFHIARNRRYVLTGYVGGFFVDHIWLFSKKNFENLRLGERIYITAKLKVYKHNGIHKYGLGFPYKFIRY